jgi:hypothetical protein
VSGTVKGELSEPTKRDPRVTIKLVVRLDQRKDFATSHCPSAPSYFSGADPPPQARTQLRTREDVNGSEIIGEQIAPGELPLQIHRGARAVSVRAGQEPKDAFGFDMEYSFPYFIIRPFCSTSCARGTTCLSGQLQHVEVRRDLIELIRSEDVIMQEESPVTADRMIN